MADKKKKTMIEKEKKTSVILFEKSVEVCAGEGVGVGHWVNIMFSPHCFKNSHKGREEGGKNI